MFIFPATLLVLLFSIASTSPTPGFNDLKAFLEDGEETIVVTWNFKGSETGISYVARYRIANRAEEFPWKFTRTTNKSVRLKIADISDGDELHFQVKAERNGQVVEDWTSPLILTIMKKVAEEASGGNNLLPPLDFTVTILGPSGVRLEWSSYPENIQGLYYMVDIKQITSKTGGNLLRQQIKVETNSFHLGSLASGEKYEITIRAATSPERVSSSAAIAEITMPRREEFFEIGTVQANSYFNNHLEGTVNLTWSVPAEMQGRIKTYKISYKEPGAPTWQIVHISGQTPKATFTNLKSDTEYILKFSTVLQNDITMESGQFRFRTSKEVITPIKDVKVIYSAQGDNVQLRWTLEVNVHESQVRGYDVYISQNNEASESQWRHYYASTNELSVQLRDFKPLTFYHVRIVVQKKDGTTIRSPHTYRFQTMAHTHSSTTVEIRRTRTLTYSNVGLGKVNISWTFSGPAAGPATGSTVFYSDRETQALEHWTKVFVEDPQQTTITITSLRPGTRYFIRVIPQLCQETCDVRGSQLYEIRTEEANEEPLVNQETPQPEEYLTRPRVLESPTSAAFQDMRIREEKQRLCLAVCNPDAIRPNCNYDERCVASLEDPNVGWCIKESLRDAILNSS